MGNIVQRRYTVGVDLGQTTDPTAIAVLERIDVRHLMDGRRLEDPKFHLRHLERLPLGISYPAQVEFVAELLARSPLAESKTELVIDQTGVGRAVFDLFDRIGVRPTGITITGGRETTRVRGGFHVAKIDLISTLQANLHNGQLRIARDLQDGKALMRELQDFRAVFTSAGNAVFNARIGAHDDLVLALGIALWAATQDREARRVKIVCG